MGSDCEGTRHHCPGEKVKRHLPGNCNYHGKHCVTHQTICPKHPKIDAHMMNGTCKGCDGEEAARERNVINLTRKTSDERIMEAYYARKGSPGGKRKRKSKGSLTP